MLRELLKPNLLKKGWIIRREALLRKFKLCLIKNLKAMTLLNFVKYVARLRQQEAVFSVNLYLIAMIATFKYIKEGY